VTWGVIFSKAIEMARSKLKKSQNGDGRFLDGVGFCCTLFCPEMD